MDGGWSRAAPKKRPRGQQCFSYPFTLLSINKSAGNGNFSARQQSFSLLHFVVMLFFYLFLPPFSSRPASTLLMFAVGLLAPPPPYNGLFSSVSRFMSSKIGTPRGTEWFTTARSHGKAENVSRPKKREKDETRKKTPCGWMDGGWKELSRPRSTRTSRKRKTTGTKSASDYAVLAGDIKRGGGRGEGRQIL